jgi:hypothetical protein
MKSTGDHRLPRTHDSSSPFAPSNDGASAQSSAEGRVRGLLDDILAVLERERDLSDALLKQALEVQRCLVADDYMALLEAAQGQEVFGQHLAQWEHRRLLLTKQLALFFPMLARLRLSDWANYLPEPYGSRLDAIQAVLQNATKQLRNVNGQNMALVQRSLRFAELALGLDSPAYGIPRGRSPRDADAPQLLDKTL